MAVNAALSVLWNTIMRAWLYRHYHTALVLRAVMTITVCRLQLLTQFHTAISYAIRLLGLGTENIDATLEEMKQLALGRVGLTEQQVSDKIAARNEARQAKNFAAADGIRQELASLGIMIMDTPAGTTWRPGLTATQ